MREFGTTRNTRASAQYARTDRPSRDTGLAPKCISSFAGIDLQAVVILVSDVLVVRNIASVIEAKFTYRTV